MRYRLRGNAGEPDDKLVGDVGWHIGDLTATSQLSIEAVAKAVGMSCRSMQRGLEQHGTTYSHLVDQVRCEIAKSLLDSDHKTIAEIAERLGYRDPSSFSRAFTRWAGTSPRVYRARHRSLT